MAAPSGASASTAPATMALYGRTITRQSLIYAVGLGTMLPFGIVSLAITTRYLEPADYGTLAVLFALASVITVLSGAGVLQGMMFTVFRISDVDDGGDDAAPIDVVAEGSTGEESAAEKRRLLGTGLALCLLFAAGFSALAVVLAGPLASLFIGGVEDGGELMRLMALSAFTGSLWRCVHQLYRLERRAVAWTMLQVLRPALVVVGTIFVLVSGHGVAGVLLATAAGTMVAVLLALVGTRTLIHFRPRRGDTSLILGAGLPMIPIVLARLVQTNVNILLLGLMATPASVGLFQVASRIAQVPGYLGSAFLYAWVPLERSMISMVSREERGRSGHSAAVFTLFFLFLLASLVLSIAGAQALVGIAGEGYEEAADLLPLVAAGVCVQLVFVGVYRATSFKRRWLWFVLLHFIWLAPYALVSWLTIPIDASYGVAVAEIVAGLVVTWGFITMDRRSGRGTPLPWARLAGAVGLAAVYVLGLELIAVQWYVTVPLGIAGAVALLAAFRLFNIVSARQLSVAREILRGAVWSRMPRRQVVDRVATLPAHEREAVELLAWRRLSPDAAASQAGVQRAVLLARLTRSLRGMTGRRRATPMDDAVGEFLLLRRTTLDHDEAAHHLCASGADPMDLHLLHEAMRSARHARRPGLRALRRTTS